MQEVTAKLRFLRISPRKVRLVADAIRGQRVTRALRTLPLVEKRGAKPVLKLLQSALANAKHNHSLSEENLKIAKITVDGGPTLKRWMPKAHGRATPIRERTSHINLVLAELTPRGVKAKDKAEDKKEEKKAVQKEPKKTEKKDKK